MDELEKLGQAIASALGAAVTAHQVVLGELSITTSPADLIKVMRFLRDDERCQFVSFLDVTAVDWPSRERRFDVVYHLLSPYKNGRIRVKLEVAEGTSVPSIIDVFPGANWFERETYDLYGVPFTGHPDMRRLLTDYGFEGKARCLRAGAARAGVPQLRFPLALGGT
jgi:NADH-quinone oxidoreductase subunit C